QREILFDVVRAGEQGRRAATERLVEFALGNLVQVLVVDPQLFTVAHDHLLVRLAIGPTESAGTLKLDHAAGLLGNLAARIRYSLSEDCARRTSLFDKGAHFFDRTGMRRPGEQRADKQHQCRESAS